MKTLLMLLALGGAAVQLSAPPATRSQAGVSFTIRVSMKRSGTMMQFMPTMPGGWTGAAVAVGRRGRIDITEGEGSLPDTFTKGDYILFEGLDAITVHPDSKSFTRPQLPDSESLSRLFDASKLKFTLSDMQVTLDSMLPAEVIEGRTTSHYRLKSSYVVTIDLSSMPGVALSGVQSTAMEMTSDFYYADVPELPPVSWTGMPDSLPRGMVPPAALSDFSKQVTAAMAHLPKGKRALRTVTSISTGTGDISIVLETTIDILDIKTRDVDVQSLQLPADFVAKPASGDQSKDSGDKWRRPPSN